MEIVLRKYGNSTVAVLPPRVLKDLGLRAGQSMTLATTPQGHITLAPKRRYRLADLIAQCDAKAPPPADLALWDRARPARARRFGDGGGSTVAISSASASNR